MLDNVNKLQFGLGLLVVLVAAGLLLADDSSLVPPSGLASSESF
jgi:hypothetical protein